MIKIGIIPLNTFGCGYYRLFIPLRNLENKYPEMFKVESIFTSSSREILEGKEHKLLHDFSKDKDIIVIQRRYGPDWEGYAKSIKNIGKQLIYELDDVFEGIPLENLKLDAIHMTNPETKRSVINMTNIADQVTVSTPELVEWLNKKINNINKVKILKNTIDFDMFPEPHFGRQHLFGDPPVVGFAGSESHKSDLRLLGGALEMVNEWYNTSSKEKVRFGFFGIILKDFWSMHPHVHYKLGVEFLKYYEILNNLRFSIGLAPLKDCFFNECKSELRFLEHAACGVPIIATDIAPFKRCIDESRGILVKNKSRKWVSAIKKLIDNENIRFNMGKNAYEYVKEHYNIAKYIKEWKKVYSE